jgi:hypothetical protein
LPAGGAQLSLVFLTKIESRLFRKEFLAESFMPASRVVRFKGRGNTTPTLPQTPLFRTRWLMARRRLTSVWLGIAAYCAAAAALPAVVRASGGEVPPLANGSASPYAPVNLNLESFPAEARGRLRAVVEQPTLSAHGPLEMFTCQPPMYHWLLDHPDQAVKLWRRLGAKCIEIEDRGNGRFGWKEGVSDVHWDLVRDAPHQRVWYAEGQVKPSLLLPMVSLKAVLVLDYAEGKDGGDQLAVRQQMHLILHTDSRAVALATRVMGDSAPKMADQFLGQLQMFYAAMAWYLDQHPDKAEKMFATLQQPDPPGTKLNSPITGSATGRGQGLEH